MRLIDADALIADIQERFCKGCDNYAGIKCKACDLDDTMDIVDGFADNSITTKQIKYFDEEEKVWKTGEVIVDE